MAELDNWHSLYRVAWSYHPYFVSDLRPPYRQFLAPCPCLRHRKHFFVRVGQSRGFMTSVVALTAMQSWWINLHVLAFVPLRWHYWLSARWAEQMFAVSLQVLVSDLCNLCQSFRCPFTQVNGQIFSSRVNKLFSRSSP